MAARKPQSPQPDPEAAQPGEPEHATATHRCVHGHECAGVDEAGHGRDVEGHGCAIDPATNTYRHPDLGAPVSLERR